jgi:hypothetical protein
MDCGTSLETALTRLLGMRSSSQDPHGEEARSAVSNHEATAFIDLRAPSSPPSVGHPPHKGEGQHA